MGRDRESDSRVLLFRAWPLGLDCQLAHKQYASAYIRRERAGALA